MGVAAWYHRGHVSELRTHGGDEGPARCAFCAAEAAGPCASCLTPVCGSCCTLTEGTSRPWAICLDCDRKKGRSLAGSWARFGLFLLGILAAMGLAVAALHASAR